MPELTTAQAAQMCGGVLEGGGDIRLHGANTLDAAGTSDLAFADSEKVFAAAAKSRAGCLIVPSAFRREDNRTLIRAQSPRLAFAQIVRELYRHDEPAHIHPTAIIDSSARIGPDCALGAYVTVGANTVIGERCRIDAGCRIGRGVAIGAGTVLHPNVTLYDRVQLGERVIVRAGSVVGADGFGYTFVSDHYELFPQVGTVEIGDDVEIGANCCIDRAALGVTRIGNGCKLDNMVHIAHNCVLGRHVVIAAQAGFSGSVTVGDYAVIGGQAGIGERAQIAAKAVLGGKCGVLTGQRVAAGEPVWGIPARPLKQHLRNLAHVSRLSRTEARLTELQKRVQGLETGRRETGDAGDQ